MLYDLVFLTWFDITTLTLTITTIVFVQLLNAAFATSSSSSSSSSPTSPTSTISIASTADTTSLSSGVTTTPLAEFQTILAPIKTEVVTPATVISTVTPKSFVNGKFREKQKSLQHDDSIHSSGRSTPLLATARNSFDSGCILPPTPPPQQHSPPPPPPPPTTQTDTIITTAASSPQLSQSTSINGTPLAPFITKQSSIGDVTPTIINATLSRLSPHTTNAGITGSSITLSDEYQEDEDTVSLENLFPCDQSEIYASKKINFIIDELIQTEINYVNNLRRGLQMYGRLHKRQDVPDTLQGKHRQLELLGNIDEILQLHDEHILPLMQRNRRDLKTLFDEFAAYFHKNHFYCYVIYSINEKTSQRLRCSHREWFQNLQNEINDRLGIDSFLVQPIQRLTRYPLLLQQFISEFYKSGISCKPVLSSVCKLETRMRRWLEVVNQSQQISDIEDISEPSLLTRGQFRKSTEFDAYHYRTRKKYRARVFLFDHCLLCTEVRKRRLVYRGHYDWLLVELQSNSLKSVTLLLKTTPTVAATTTASSPSSSSSSVSAPTSPSSVSSSSSAAVATTPPPSTTNGIAGNGTAGSDAKPEYDFNANEAITLKHWLYTAHATIDRARIDALQRGRFSLPMDLVLGVVFAIWFIWIYL